MTGARAGLTLAGLLLANVAAAQEMVAVQDVSSLSGKWKGPGGPGALGNSPAVVVEQTNNPDGTYEAVVTLSSGQRVPSKGTMKAQPDGTVAYEGQTTAGVYRLYVVKGQRVIRAEAKNKTSGAASWAESHGSEVNRVRAWARARHYLLPARPRHVGLR